jgi:uncharacterized membrane protein YgdD (TMEM256/DUF423 family)
MSGTTWIRIGAILGGLGVVAGAFGAHGLEGKISARNLGIFETAARYQMYHAPAIIAVGLLLAIGRSSGFLKASGWLFAVGTVVFSGSLYALALTDQRWLGAITPFGGLAQILGWFALAIGASGPRKSSGVEA